MPDGNRLTAAGRQFGVSKYGAMNRAFRGLADCFAVRWMGTRMLKYDAHEE